MFTRQEKQVILFLMGMTLVGLGINFMLKLNSTLERFVRAEDATTLIDINKATYEELLTIKGISPHLAKNIVTYRDSFGPFRNLEELKEVKGIGEFRYNKIKDFLTIK